MGDLVSGVGTGLGLGTGSLVILLVGLVFKLAGFAARDELWLRVLVICGFSCDAAFYFFRTEPIIASVLSNIALLSINVVLIFLILFERTAWWMTAADRATLVHFPTLTPGQFRKLRKLATDRQVEAGRVLMREGQPVTCLMLVFADTIVISKEGESFPVAGPAFVGEVAFLTGNPSSADVVLPEGGRVLAMDAKRLRQRMERSLGFKNAMVALFGTALARKVADSVPMTRAGRGV